MPRTMLGQFRVQVLPERRFSQFSAQFCGQAHTSWRDLHFRDAQSKRPCQRYRLVEIGLRDLPFACQRFIANEPSVERMHGKGLRTTGVRLLFGGRRVRAFPPQPQISISHSERASAAKECLILQ